MTLQYLLKKHSMNRNWRKHNVENETFHVTHSEVYIYTGFKFIMHQEVRFTHNLWKMCNIIVNFSQNQFFYNINCT